MKRHIFILINLAFYFGYSQTHKATYSLKVEANPITGGTELADEINPLAEDNEFYLYFDKTKSYYTSYNIENNIRNSSDTYGMSFQPMLYNYFNKTFQQNVEIEKLYHFTYENQTSWTVTNESKIINGRTCFKANGILTDIIGDHIKFKIEAWFAPEINYPVGPGNYAGLRGIIVYLIFENYIIFKLEKIKFNDNSIDLDKIQYEGEVLSKEKYIEYLKD